MFTPDGYPPLWQRICRHVEQVSNLITEKVETIINAVTWHLIYSKRKAISALFPYALHLGRSREQGMVDVLFCAAVALDWDRIIWNHAEPFLMRLSNTQNLPLDWITTLLSPHAAWNTEKYDGRVVARWADAVLAVSYTEEAGQSVVDMLLHIASVDLLQPHIPDSVWAWLKKQPSLWRDSVDKNQY